MTEELNPDDFDPAALAEIAEQARRRHHLPASVQTIGTTPILNDPAAWAMERRIAVAREAALTAGEELPSLGDWRTSDLPEDVRARLAHWYAVGCSKFWETECEGIRAAARAPFLAFSAAVAAAIPRRYSDARQLPPKNDPEHETVRAMLQKRVKSPVAYRMALAAAVGIAEGRVRQVLLVGPSGAGKSTIAAILLRALDAYFAERWEKTLPAMPPRPVADPAEFLYRAPPVVAPHCLVRPGFTPRGAEAFQRRVSLGAWGRLSRRRGDDGPVQWITARDVFRIAANPATPRFGEEPADPLAKWKRAPLTLLDDIGGEPEQRNVEAVDGILWHRHDEDDEVVTVTTTGFFDPAAVPANIEAMGEDETLSMLAPLTARYGAALVRRIAEPGQTVVIPVIPRTK